MRLFLWWWSAYLSSFSSGGTKATKPNFKPIEGICIFIKTFKVHNLLILQKHKSFIQFKQYWTSTLGSKVHVLDPHIQPASHLWLLKTSHVTWWPRASIIVSLASGFWFAYKLIKTLRKTRSKSTIPTDSFTCLSIKLLPHLPGANELTHWGRVT